MRFALNLKRFRKARYVAILIFHKELGGKECKGDFFIRLITNFFVLKINLYFTRESFDWHEIYLLDEWAIPSIEMSVLDFYVVCFGDDWVFMESYLNGDAVVLTAFFVTPTIKPS
ncbi:hypothetical protein MMM7_00730 [Helicobacter pylori]